MKKVSFLFMALALMTFAMTGCKNKTQKQNRDTAAVAIPTVADSTVYGVCGENTAMHTLSLITDAGDTLQYILDDTEENPVVGGLLAGDRLAVLEGPEMDGEKTAKKVINLTTLLGKWTSLDKNFEIEEGGEVKSYVEAEKNPWTSWKILNGKLVLNKDTFTIDNLGSDSLYLENNEGIFVYKRAK